MDDCLDVAYLYCASVSKTGRGKSFTENLPSAVASILSERLILGLLVSALWYYRCLKWES
jgi:hypothetical protein